jgi:NAD(P)-dependent dehydrogenase (short-subunit alcohol dehydrogenase family)
MPLSGRVALITGAGRGVGEGIAHALAQRGVAVVVNDLHEERAQSVAEAIVKRGGLAHGVAYDVGNPAQVLAGTRTATEIAGQIDIFVSNAGIPEGRRAVLFKDSVPERDWAPYVSMNVNGLLHGLHALLGGMCERGWGRVVLISSGSGARGLPAGQSVYGASKAFGDGLLRHIALEVGREGVTINAVAPGLMRSALYHQAQDEVAAAVAAIPVGRIGEAPDIGEAVAWLASEEASWVTGQVVHVNGGAYQGR